MKNKFEIMKERTNAPTIVLCTATRRQTTNHLSPSGTCTATTTSQTTVDVGLHTAELPPTEAQKLTLSLVLQALDLLS